MLGRDCYGRPINLNENYLPSGVAPRRFDLLRHKNLQHRKVILDAEQVNLRRRKLETVKAELGQMLCRALKGAQALKDLRIRNQTNSKSDAAKDGIGA